MSRFYGLCLGFVIIVLWWSGCTEKDTITNVIETKNAIYGRVIPAEAGTLVSAWQAREVRQTAIDNAGYFVLADLEPGLYEVRISTPSGAKRIISDVEVKSMEGVSLGVINIASIIWPFLGTAPDDGITNWPASADIGLLSEIPLSPMALLAATTITPAVDGEWEEEDSYQSGQYYYQFHPTVQLRSITQYQVKIGPSLHIGTSAEWGDSLIFSFKTDSVRLRDLDWMPYYSKDSLASSFTGSLAAFYYSSAVDPSTVEAAVRIEPDIDYAVLVRSASTLEIDINGGLCSGTTYRIIIYRTLADIFGNTNVKEDTAVFKTRPFQVTYRSYPSSQDNVPPRLTASLLSYRYSVSLDSLTVSSAVSIMPPAPLEIDVVDNYDGCWLYVYAPDGLRPETEYTVTISADLRAADGATIGQSESATFSVQPLELIGFGFPRDYYSMPPWDTVTNPGNQFNCHFFLNADVDLDSFNVATTITPPISGFWYLDTEYSNRPYLAFFPTAPVSLAPEQTYTVTIDGSVGLCDGIGFGDDVVRHFTVRPVAITSFSPSPGYQSVYQYTTIQIYFNAPMNRASVEAAFYMTTWEGVPVSGSFYWPNDKEMSFDPTYALIPGNAYKAGVSTSARCQSGAYLKEPGYTFFRVSN